MTYLMGAPGKNYITKTPECPICDREGVDVGRDMFECPIHGYLEKKPAKVAVRLQARATIALTNN